MLKMESKVYESTQSRTERSCRVLRAPLGPHNVEFENIRFILVHFEEILCNWLLNQHSQQYNPVLTAQ